MATLRGESVSFTLAVDNLRITIVKSSHRGSTENYSLVLLEGPAWKAKKLAI